MLAFGVVLTGCDTTEDSYRLGDLSDVKISTEPVSQLRLAADGKAKDIEVRSNVYWSVENLGNRFTVQASTDKGDGTISVSGPVNVNATQTPSETVLITARDFDKEIRIEVLQARLQFEMSEREYAVAPQEGTEVALRFNSSIDWQFVAKSGELGWLTFNPGATGTGEWDEMEVAALWTPNYTTSPRSIELQLRPSDESLLEFITLPSSFILSQEAGTLPENVGVSITGEPTVSECPVSVSYSSKAPIETVGVILSCNGSETRVVAPTPESGYPLSGNVAFNLTGLAAGMHYEVRPFVVSKVGETVGDVTASFTTDASFVGPRIVDVNIVPGDRSVNAIITVESDVALKVGGICIYDVNETELVNYGVTLSGMSQTFECNSVDFLQPNTEYLLMAYVEYDNPDTGEAQGVSGGMIPFKTTYRIPAEDDNTPIE